MKTNNSMCVICETTVLNCEVARESNVKNVNKPTMQSAADCVAAFGFGYLATSVSLSLSFDFYQRRDVGGICIVAVDNFMKRVVYLEALKIPVRG